METLAALLTPWESNPLVTSGFPFNKGPVMWSADVFLSLHKLLKKQTSCRWYKMPWPSNDGISVSLCRRRSESRLAIKPPYTCATHGPYREYNEYLIGLKNWCVLWVTIAIFPLTLLLFAANVRTSLHFSSSTHHAVNIPKNHLPRTTLFNISWCEYTRLAWWRHKMETFAALLALCAGNSSPVNSPHKGQWHGALMFSLICARINGWANNGEAGDLRLHRAHYDVIVMSFHEIDALRQLYIMMTMHQSIEIKFKPQICFQCFPVPLKFTRIPFY